MCHPISILNHMDVRPSMLYILHVLWNIRIELFPLLTANSQESNVVIVVSRLYSVLCVCWCINLPYCSLCPVVAGDPLEVDLLHCYLKVSRLLPTEDCDRLCVCVRVCVCKEVVCVWEGVFGAD